MSENYTDSREQKVLSVNASGASSAVLVCEHASHHIPEEYDALGLRDADRTSHAAWDPGALAVSTRLSKHLDAVLIASSVSRLVYDCNRPPEAPSAMPARSEVIDVPGNAGLSQAERDIRTQRFYRPFQRALENVIKRRAHPVIVTIHSFTPTYHGAPRAVEIGVLHDSDTRLADAMLDSAAAHTKMRVERNAPYGPEHGVTHTLQKHGIEGGHLNVMLEIRNDLIATAAEQDAMALMLAKWIAAAFKKTQSSGDIQCQA